MGTIYRNGVPFVGSGGAGGVEMTMAEYELLPESEKMNGAIYFITDGDVSYPSASQMRYDNTESQIPSTTVQGAIDENRIEINSLKAGLTDAIVSGNSITVTVPLSSTGWKYIDIPSPTKTGYSLIGYLANSSTYRVVGCSYQLTSLGTTSVSVYVTTTASVDGAVYLIPLYKKN